MEDLDSATLDDVRDWFKTYYTPSNAVLVLAGDITVSEAREKARRYFNEIVPGPPVAHQRAWTAKMAGEHRESVQDRVPQARIYKVWNTPGQTSAPLGICVWRPAFCPVARTRGSTSAWSMTIRSPLRFLLISMSVRLGANSLWSQPHARARICGKSRRRSMKRSPDLLKAVRQPASSIA